MDVRFTTKTQTAFPKVRTPDLPESSEGRCAGSICRFPFSTNTDVEGG